MANERLVKLLLSNLPKWIEIRMAIPQACPPEYADLDWRVPDLSGANLSKANLRNADLREADLSGANLSGSDLRYADLNGANLSGANLSSAKITQEEIMVANGNEETQLPAGIKRPSQWIC